MRRSYQIWFDRMAGNDDDVVWCDKLSIAKQYQNWSDIVQWNDKLNVVFMTSLNLKYKNAEDCMKFEIHFELIVSRSVFTIHLQLYKNDATGVKM